MTKVFVISCTCLVTKVSHGLAMLMTKVSHGLAMLVTKVSHIPPVLVTKMFSCTFQGVLCICVVAKEFLININASMSKCLSGKSHYCI